MEDIADKLHRTVGSLRQRILHLGLRRSNRISRLLKWAPEELRAGLNNSEPEKWIEGCYAWREQQQRQVEQIDDEATQRAWDERLRQVAEIDAQTDLTRNDKMRAKRLLGPDARRDRRAISSPANGCARSPVRIIILRTGIKRDCR